MKRLVLPAGAVLAVLASGGATTALALRYGPPVRPTAAHAQAYEHAYWEVARRLGRRAPGRNIITEAIKRDLALTDAQVVSSLHVLRRMLAAATSPTATTALAQGAAPVTGASGVPACASESGTNYSTGPSNTNPSSGATGRYQITPSTASAYGCSLSTPAGQDACAQLIYAHQGAGAWVGCGG